MRRILQVVSWVSLADTILPSLLYLGGMVGLDDVKQTTLLATIGWFVATPLWMGRPTAGTRTVER